MRPGPIKCEGLEGWPSQCGRDTDATFKVTAYLCGNKDCASCNAIWAAIWKATDRGQGKDTGGPQAVAEAGNE